MTKIYTKKGDKGETSLIGGYQVLKNDPRIEAYGSIDELNSAIGITIAEISNVKYPISNIKNELINVQNDLFEIGSVLADPRAIKVQNLDKRIKETEEFIDMLSEELPELKNFILPGGGESGSYLHFVRTVARRVERRVVELSRKVDIDSQILVYLNRLSDLFFVMARDLNYKEGVKEIIWPSFAKASEGKKNRY